MTKEVKRQHLVAVYGSLRQGLGNHRLLEDAKFLGTFETPPYYTMYSVGNSFPGLIKKGSTSVVMEAYLVSDSELSRLHSLEGYMSGRDESLNHYNKRDINTPFGPGIWYEYARNPENLKKVESGDWTKFKKSFQMIYS